MSGRSTQAGNEDESMGSASKAPSTPAPGDDLGDQLEALFRRLRSRPPPPHLLDLVEQLDAAFPAARREPALDPA